MENTTLQKLVFNGLSIIKKKKKYNRIVLLYKRYKRFYNVFMDIPTMGR